MESEDDQRLHLRTFTKVWICSAVLKIAAFKRNDFKATRDYFEFVLNEAKKVKDRNREGKAHTLLGTACHSLGDFKKAIEFYQQALSIAKEIGNKDLEGNTYGNLGHAYQSLGDFKKAIEFN